MSIALDNKGGSVRAILLVAGCCIGAGMLGLPVVSASAGLFPATLAMAVCYLFAIATGLLILEATLWFDHRVNLISLADFALGKVGRFVTWILFLFLFYCLFVAYIDGGGQLFAGLMSSVFAYPVSREIGIICCVGFAAGVAYGGTRAVSGLSRLFLFGLAFSYCALLSFGLPHIQGEQLLHTNWKAAVSTIPILLVCFGYQNLIPTLTYYVKKDISILRKAIVIGNMIPFVIYFLWNVVILGILPEADSLAFAKVISHTDMVTGLLEVASKSQYVMFFATTFSFFAILTPFTTNTLTFVDFIKDGLKISKETKYELAIYSLVLLPPTLLTLSYPHLFLKALGFAGGFADVILFGVLPVTIVWIGRYVKKIEGPYKAPGGKLFLIGVLLFSLSFLLIRS